MNTSKFIAVCLITGATLVISKSSSAQISLGVANVTHLTSAVSLNTPSVSNALRASNAVTASTASQAKATGATTAATTRQIVAKTTTASGNINSPSTGVEVKTTASANAGTSVQKQ